MLIKKNKRAQFFTLIAILLLALMFISFEIYSTIQQRSSTRDRVESMNNFLLAIEKNLERQMYISGFRIIFLAQTEIATNINYISDIEDFFNESFFNGSVNGVPSEIMIGANYTDLVNSINAKASKINVEITLENSVISVSQIDPWNIKFEMISNFVMRDKEDLALWNKTQNISALIPIQGFEDPFYLVNSIGRLSKQINQTLYEETYTDWPEVSNLSTHASNGYYAANSDAPSFLMRLEGNFSSDPNGIESFVNPNLLQAQGIDITDFDSTGTKTVVDYIYFDKSNSTSGDTVSGMPAWFRIDDGHKAKYQIP